MSDTLLVASNNVHKIAEIKAILGAFYPKIASQKEMGITHEVLEDGQTFLENAIKKACELAELSGLDAIADDSGLCVDALGGAPGVYSARYVGGHGDDTANNQKLMAEIAQLPPNQRGGQFVCAIALKRQGQPVLTAVGTVEGVLLTQPQGENGFGYDPLFYLPNYKKTMAQLTAEEKNAISHRFNALQALQKTLLNA